MVAPTFLNRGWPLKFVVHSANESNARLSCGACSALFGVSGWASELRVWASTVEEAVKDKDNEKGDESPDLLVDDTVAVGKHYGVRED